MGILQVSPDQGVVGTPMTISGSHLAANASVELTWSTANATWLVQAQPDTVNYLGRSDTLFAVVLATTTTDANGAFKVWLKTPQDWGGLHDIYTVVKGLEVAHGGFITLRTVTVTPRSGPVGTPITITYSGLGDSLYTGGASLLWDNHYVGEMMANWTRGVATATISGGRPGRSAHHPDRQCHQLLVPERAPVADPLHKRRHSDIHRHQGRRATCSLDRLAGRRRSDAERQDDPHLERPWCQLCGEGSASRAPRDRSTPETPSLRRGFPRTLR